MEDDHHPNDLPAGAPTPRGDEDGTEGAAEHLDRPSRSLRKSGKPRGLERWPNGVDVGSPAVRPRLHSLLRAGTQREAARLSVLVLLAVVTACMVLAVLQKTRDEAVSAAREASEFTPPPHLSASPPPGGPLITVISDETAISAGTTVSAQELWPRLLGDGIDGRVTVLAVPGAGYSTSGSDGSSFVDLAGDVPPDAQVVLFVGGAADSRSSALSIAQGATAAFSSASEQAPGAALVAVGPLFPASGSISADDAPLRTVLRASTRIAGVRWIDPRRSRWLVGVDSTAALTVSSERVVANRIETVVRSAD